MWSADAHAEQGAFGDRVGVANFVVGHLEEVGGCMWVGLHIIDLMHKLRSVLRDIAIEHSLLFFLFFTKKRAGRMRVKQADPCS